ncbi:recombinase RecU [Bacillus wiedmannii]|nr:recombinase RecU [Bacillus wiedmannii]PHF97051.1 recombinase RecU [Bacillus wiedmannii]
MGLGNRGMAFEMLINLANKMYQRGGVSLIDKCPTPVKVLFLNFPKKVSYSMQMTSYVKTTHIILRKGI